MHLKYFKLKSTLQMKIIHLLPLHKFVCAFGKTASHMFTHGTLYCEKFNKNFNANYKCSNKLLTVRLSSTQIQSEHS